MSKETKPKRTRSTKKSNTAELEAKIAELEAKITNLSSQARPSETRPQTRAPPPESSYSEPPQPGEVSPAYATTSTTRYTGNKYFATRARLAYHPPAKQYKGTTVSTTTARPSSSEPEYAPEPSTSYSDTMREERKQGRRSMWKAKGASYEDYVPEHERRAPPPPPREEPKPRPSPKQEAARRVEMEAAGEVAPAYATTSSTGYTGNKYFATRRRLAYHPPNKQYTGSSTTDAPPAPEPPKPRSRGTLPTGFKP